MLLLATSCGGDDDPTNTPTPKTTTVSKKFKSDREGEVYRGYLNGSIKTAGNTNNAERTAELKITTTSNKSTNNKTANKSAVVSLDSVLGIFNNTVIYKEKNVILSSTPTTKDVSNAKITYSHVFEWSGNLPANEWFAFKDGDTLKTEQTINTNPVNVILNFFDNENTTTIDSLQGKLAGYYDIEVKDISIKGELDFKGGTVPNGSYEFKKKDENLVDALFKIVDRNTGKTIENLLVEYNGTTIAIDSIFKLTQVPKGDYSVLFKPSDSTWLIPTGISANVDLVYEYEEFIIETFTNKKNFSANLIVNVDDQDNNDLEGVILSANNTKAITNANGRASINNIIQLVARDDKPWLAQDRNITYDLFKDGFEDFDAKTVAINEGDNVFSAVMTKTNASSANKYGEIYVFGQLRGSLIENVKITLINKAIPDTTYTVHSGNIVDGYFPKVFLGATATSQEYEIIVEDDDSDDRFEITTTNHVINEGANPNKAVILEEFANLVDITTTIYDSQNLSRVSGQTVYLIQTNNNAQIASKVTNGAGEIIFNDVPGNSEYYLVNESPNTYKKTNKNFKTKEVVLRSDKTDAINTTAVNYLFTQGGDQIPANIVQKFKPLAYNTEFLLGHLRMYHPAIAGGNQVYKDQFDEAATFLGMSGAIIDYDTSFSDPTQSMIDNYNPYPENRQVFAGDIGTNIDSYSGTSTGTEGKVLPNGNEIIIYGKSFNLAGLDKAGNHHELGNLLGFPVLNGNTTNFKTSRETSAPESFTFQESTYDIPVMSMWLQLGKHHYDTTDSQGRMIEYNITTKIE